MADASKNGKRPGAQSQGITAEAFAHKSLLWWLPLLYLLISSAFYLRTYDSAQVKISIMQMGGAALLAMWLSRLFEAGRGALNRDDVVCLSPFLGYLLVGILSYLHAPYHMASTDFFLRHFFFMTAALIVIYEFDSPGMDRLTAILLWAAWIAVGYGFWQWVDQTWWPPGIGKGIDPFIWRGAFGERIFSTYGNPNFFADFLVIVFPILLTQFLKTRRFSLVALMGMLLVDLIKTGTKGAWLGFALVILLFGIIAFLYFKEAVAPYRKAVFTVVAVGVLGFLGVVAKDLRTRVVSVNFRLFTWEATWEMVMTHPWIGTGVGSFPPIYPAFRRPPIFHIEGKHNTETDHAEDEYIEQLFDNGILGFGVFLWMVLSTLVVGFRSLGQLTSHMKDGRPPPRAYDIIGYMVAFMGMLGHNCFDVSMRFVSSGVYLGLLSGTIVNLARGKGLYELHVARQAGPKAAASVELPRTGGLMDQLASGWAVLSEFLIWPARLGAWGGLAYMCFKIVRDFDTLQGPLARMVIGGEILQWWIAWGTLAACVAAMAFIFSKLIYLSENPAVSLMILGMLYPLNIFWGFFKADVHHNIAIFFSKERNWDKALENYKIVESLNPDFVMAMYFKGNVFNDRFDMRKLYNPAWGDVGNVPHDDYERALSAYDQVRALAPNYVQTHHQVGALHMKRADYAMQTGHPEEAQRYWDRAMERFRLYQAIDPIFAPNFYRMGQVYMMQKKYAEAVKVYESFIKAEGCLVEPSLIAKSWLRTSILSYQAYRPEPGLDIPVHRHETGEAYLNLGNAYFMLEDWDKGDAAYRRGLALEPGNENIKRNLGVLYQRAQAVGRLKAVQPPPNFSTSTYNAFTGYEIVPAKK